MGVRRHERGLKGPAGFTGITCGICNEPIGAAESVHIDHILPKSVALAAAGIRGRIGDWTSAELGAAGELAAALFAAGAQTIDSSQNLRPVHARCNLRKGSKIILLDDASIDDCSIEDTGLDDAGIDNAD